MAKGPMAGAAFLAALVERRVEEVRDVPGMGGPVYLRELSVGEREALSARVFGADGALKASAGRWNMAVVLATLCDAEGQRIAWTEEQEARAHAEGSQVVLERILPVALRINGLGKAAEEEAEKNSAAASGGSSSG